MVKIIAPLLKELNILPAAQPRKRSAKTRTEAANVSAEPKKLGRPKKAKTLQPKTDFRDGLNATQWNGNTMYTYTHFPDTNEIKVKAHSENQYPPQSVGVWRIKTLKMPSITQAIRYQLNQKN